jgi:hypothetical protein
MRCAGQLKSVVTTSESATTRNFTRHENKMTNYLSRLLPKGFGRKIVFVGQ